MSASPSPRSVTFLLPRYGWHPNGGFRVVYTYANLLVARGWAVNIVHPRRLPSGGWPEPSGAWGRARRVLGGIRERLATPDLTWARLDDRVRLLHVPALVDRYVPDADAVIATWWSTAEAALDLSSSRGVRFHLIQGYETWFGEAERVHAVWRAPLHRIFVARWLRQKAVELGAAPPGTHIPNAVDADVFRLHQPIEGRAPVVATLYSSEAFKGAPLAIEILMLARRRVPDLRAIVFGVEAPPPGLPEWIRYERRPDPHQLARDVYGPSAVYLCASLSEGWHLPPAEAMACGCALVSSDIGGVKDYAADLDTALLYPPGDTAAGADRLVTALLDAPLRFALARRGVERIGTFSWEASADRLASLLEDTIRSDRAAALESGWMG